VHFISIQISFGASAACNDKNKNRWNEERRKLYWRLQIVNSKFRSVLLYALFLIFSDAFCCPARCPLFYRTSVKGLRRLSVSVSDWDTAYMYGLYMSDGQWLWGHSAGVEVEVYDDVFLLCAFRVFMPRFRHVCVFVHISKYRT